MGISCRFDARSFDSFQLEMRTMKVETYLFLEGQCEEAINFYVQAVGAKLEMLMRFKDSPDGGKCPDGSQPPGDKVMHASFTIGESRIMASDGFARGNPAFKGFALSVSVATEAEAQRVFTALSAGGNVTMPLTKTFFSPSFGMVSDRFGVQWMVLVPSDPQHLEQP
jgi:PhnB protein